MFHNKERVMPLSFYRLWVGEGISALAGSWGTMANAWLVFHWTGSTTAIGTMWLFYFIPSLCIQWGLGPFLDRWDRARILTWCQWSRSAAFLIILGCLFFQWEAAGLLYLVAAWTGTIQALYTPTTQALLPALVSKEMLTRANARIDATFRVMNMAGPVLGGWAVAVAGAELNVAGVVMFYAFGGWLASGLPSIRGRKKEEQLSWKEAIREGIHFFSRDSLLICLTVLMAVIQWAVAVLLVLGLPYVTMELGHNTLAYGWFLAGYSSGYLLGSLGVSRWMRGQPLPAVMIGANVIGGLSFIGLALSPHLGWALVMEVMAGVCAPFFHVLSLRLFQERVPSPLMAQVFSLRVLVMRVVMPVGTVAAGWMGSAWGIRPALALTGGVVIMITLVGGGWLAAQWLRKSSDSS
ncbi:putative MFS family arabinose efflux permease [Desmospora activa DSM 45169]|uniref:Putative MFS family arabinose efflux permease n=2 Tax=Desmospora TaxID=500614 RepID=A0A2T4ZDC0_9BACL|nr:putative MFS family arabinose efflux permease [Desmospora activa DSM 45169]